jgi:hypothetical protein
MTLGHPEENQSHPGGNAMVTSNRPPAAHRGRPGCTRAGHSRCARRHAALAAQTQVVPGIHRPYDDYVFLYTESSTTK